MKQRTIVAVFGLIVASALALGFLLANKSSSVLEAEIQTTSTAKSAATPSYPNDFGDTSNTDSQVAANGQQVPLPKALRDAPGETAAQVFERLSRSARRGAPQDAYKAFEIARFCRSTESFTNVLNSVRAGERTNEMLAAMRDTQATVLRTCAGITPAQLDERYELIAIAAAAGVKGATTAFIATGRAGEASRTTLGSQDEGWKQAAIQYLTRDVVAGDVEAMAMLSHLYTTGDIVDKDLRSALAYRLAAVEARRLNEQKVDVSAAQRADIAALSDQMQPDDVKAAKEMAKGLLARCCVQKEQEKGPRS